MMPETRSTLSSALPSPEPPELCVADCLADRANLAAILDSVADGILTVDLGQRITWVNRAARRILGLDPDVTWGRSCREVFRQILVDQPCLVCQALEQGQYVQEAEREVACQDGRRRVVLVTTNPILDARGERTGVVVVFHDVQEVRELTEALKGRQRFYQLIGKSHLMERVYELIEQVADSPASVLIEGESGTGKELVARAIHYRSRRAEKPFVAVNCSALAETLLESELFGHVRGAFTGATYNKMGRFELAQGGTLFLDEIGDLSPLIQLKLLRVLQEHEFERVGESKPRRADVRIVAATNRDLKALVREGRFREDVYYRLKVVPIRLPPLRERKEDIPLLVDHFVQRFNQSFGKQLRGPSREAMAALMVYDWPGNVRELEHAVEHAFVCARGARLALDDLPAELKAPPAPRRGPARLRLDPAAEAEAIRLALEASGGNRAEAARTLGVGRTTFWRKARMYGLVPAVSRTGAARRTDAARLVS